MFNGIMNWLQENIEWLFSGAAVAVPIAIIGWIFFRRRYSVSQKQKGGHHSTNVQIGGNLEINKKDEHE